jgi:uncharacterized protein
MRGFYGRRKELRRLANDLEAIRSDGRGRLITIRGRRRVGKSWLVEEFIERSKAPHVFFAASRQTPERELAKFAERMARSSLPSAAGATGVAFDSWEAALTLAATGAERARPNVVVIDEFPYLLEGGGRDAVEGAVQAAWDRLLSRAPVLLILVGSDLAMMRSLDEYGRPLHGHGEGRLPTGLETKEFCLQPGSRGEVGLDRAAGAAGARARAPAPRPG